MLDDRTPSDTEGKPITVSQRRCPDNLRHETCGECQNGQVKIPQ